MRALRRVNGAALNTLLFAGAAGQWGFVGLMFDLIRSIFQEPSALARTSGDGGRTDGELDVELPAVAVFDQ